MKKGMTLIEVLVASVILVIGVVGLISSFVTCQRMIIQNSHRQNAMYIINEHFEGVQNRESAGAVSSFVSYYSTPQKVTTTLNTGMSQDYMFSMKIDDSAIEPVTGAFLSVVTATVTWNGGGPEREMSVSMITNEPEI